MSAKFPEVVACLGHVEVVEVDERKTAVSVEELIVFQVSMCGNELLLISFAQPATDTTEKFAKHEMCWRMHEDELLEKPVEPAELVFDVQVRTRLDVTAVDHGDRLGRCLRGSDELGCRAVAPHRFAVHTRLQKHAE